MARPPPTAKRDRACGRLASGPRTAPHGRWRRRSELPVPMRASHRQAVTDATASSPSFSHRAGQDATRRLVLRHQRRATRRFPADGVTGITSRGALTVLNPGLTRSCDPAPATAVVHRCAPTVGAAHLKGDIKTTEEFFYAVHACLRSFRRHRRPPGRPGRLRPAGRYRRRQALLRGRQRHHPRTFRRSAGRARRRRRGPHPQRDLACQRQRRRRAVGRGRQVQPSRAQQRGRQAGHGRCAARCAERAVPLRFS